MWVGKFRRELFLWMLKLLAFLQNGIYYFFGYVFAETAYRWCNSFLTGLSFLAGGMWWSGTWDKLREPDALGGMFHMTIGFTSHVHLERTLRKHLGVRGTSKKIPWKVIKPPNLPSVTFKKGKSIFGNIENWKRLVGDSAMRAIGSRDDARESREKPLVLFS